ncbi:branched-chain amino acid ABC transporter permease [Bradyrhizobium sp. sGM-13]|uniref:branched-chain amino acid ABC transporter permease n=1 Tax=Bradyrhizobium sp. sGM-13 TaxID=2831781 RepID=UPI001BCF7806|nr:branched-chain amino acid ABC transporter permease [Bradyrhizobium sp. sGM-13]
MEMLSISLLNGTIYGLLLFMIAAGLTLIFGMMGVLNFAHGAFYMLGAYAGYVLSARVGFFPGLLVAGLIVAAIGAMVERYMLRSVHAHGHAHELLLTFGLLFVFDEIVKFFFGYYPVSYRVPETLSFSVFRIGSLEYPAYRLFVGLVSIGFFGALVLILRFTRIGLVVRAAVHKPMMVEALGHNVPLVMLLVFAVGAGMAGLAGAVAGAFYPTSPAMASEIGTIVFVVVVVGGLGSLGGAFIASLMIGILTTLMVGVDTTLADTLSFVGFGSWGKDIGGIFAVPLSASAGTLPFALMLMVLLLRPAGLMGERT